MQPLHLPYYAVIFTSTLRPTAEGYEETAARMLEGVSRQPGFLGSRSFRERNGAGVTISYWESLEAIRAWRNEPAHAQARKRGAEEWYAEWRIEIAEVREARP